MASALFPISDKSKRIVMLTVYMDETGHSRDEKQRFNGMAGLIAPSHYWERLELKWKATLREFKIPFFHMKDFACFGGDFEGWSEAKRRKLYGKLLRHMEGAYPFPIGSILQMSDYRKLAGDLEGIFGDPYYIGFGEVIAYVTAFVSNVAPPREKAALVFSDQVEFRHKALQFYESISELEQIRQVTTPPDFRDMRELVPLQAADIVAYELYKEYERRLYRQEAKPRYGYQVIVKMSDRLGFKIPMFAFSTEQTLAHHLKQATAFSRREVYWKKRKATS